MNVRLLLHPNIPKPLHGIAPRVVLGDKWWDIERKKAYEKAEFCCEACGVHKSKAKYHQWLEAHEFYDFDNGVLRLKRLVALCHSCHNFIHDGRLSMLLSNGEISREKYEDIYNHGMELIKMAGLETEYENRHKYNGPEDWNKWRMEINGKLYGPSSKSYTDWENGAWRNWKPYQQLL